MWYTHIRVEYASEALRQSLNENPTFDPFKAFNSLDFNNNGSITANELRKLLYTRGIVLGFKKSETLLSLFDKNKNGYVTFSEFVDETRNKSPVAYERSQFSNDFKSTNTVRKLAKANSASANFILKLNGQKRKCSQTSCFF